MNGIEKITARIEADAAAEAVRIAQDAAQEAAAIRADFDKQAQERYWARAREGVKATEDRVQRLSKTADMEARKSVLAFKQETVSMAFDAAYTRLLAMEPQEYVAFLAQKAAQASNTGTEELILNAAHREQFGAQTVEAANRLLSETGKTARLTLARETGDFAAGLILRQGSVSVNCTVEALIGQARSELAPQVAAVLFS